MINPPLRLKRFALPSIKPKTGELTVPSWRTSVAVFMTVAVNVS
jgi:hypothetical protein